VRDFPLSVVELLKLAYRLMGTAVLAAWRNIIMVPVRKKQMLLYG